MTDVLTPLMSLLFLVSFLLGFTALLLIDVALMKARDLNCESHWLRHMLTKRGK